MGKRVRPPKDQQCECGEAPLEAHEYEFDAQYEGDVGWDCCTRPLEAHGWPNHGGKLERVYWEKGERMCYGWWCLNCRSWLGDSEDCDPWPTASDGRFMPSVHCQVIPGLD